MSYENFGVVKTLVLPIPETEISVDEYKERFGIDLKEYLILQDGLIGFDFKNCIVYLSDYKNYVGGIVSGYTQNFVFPIACIKYQAWESGSNDGYLQLGSYDSTQLVVDGLHLFIERDKDFEIDNIKIGGAGA